MDGNGSKPRGGDKAARQRPAPAPDATQQPAAARAALEAPASSAAAAAEQVDDGRQPVAAVGESRAGGGAEEEGNGNDDEQVEMFYALLANIRAMRGLLQPHNTVASSSLCGGGDTGDSTREKRLRLSAGPPWRPAFRMEDFEEPAPAAAAVAAAACETRKRTRGTGHGEQDHGDGENSGQ